MWFHNEQGSLPWSVARPKWATLAEIKWIRDLGPCVEDNQQKLISVPCVHEAILRLHLTICPSSSDKKKKSQKNNSRRMPPNGVNSLPIVWPLGSTAITTIHSHWHSYVLAPRPACERELGWSTFRFWARAVPWGEGVALTLCDFMQISCDWRSNLVVALSCIWAEMRDGCTVHALGV